MDPIDPDDLTEDEVRAVVNSLGFQKMLRYRRLGQGIEVLEEEDEVFDSLVSTITKQHTHVSSESSTREFFRLFREEVQTFTDPMMDEEGEETNVDPDDLLVESDEDGRDA